MTRRQALALFAASLARAAAKLPANQNVKWGLGSNLWNYFPRVPFTDILDVMRDTGFIGLRLTQFPRDPQDLRHHRRPMQKEAEKRGCRIVTISFNGAAHDPAKRAEVVAAAKTAMTFLKEFGANHLVVFSPSRRFASAPKAFETMCETFNAIGDAGARDGLLRRAPQSHGADRAEPGRGRPLHGHDRPQALPFLARHRAPAPRRLRCRQDAREAQGAPRDGRLQRRETPAERRARFFDRNSIFDLGDGEIDFPGATAC